MQQATTIAAVAAHKDQQAAGETADASASNRAAAAAGERRESSSSNDEASSSGNEKRQQPVSYISGSSGVDVAHAAVDNAGLKSVVQLPADADGIEQGAMQQQQQEQKHKALPVNAGSSSLDSEGSEDGPAAAQGSSATAATAPAPAIGTGNVDEAAALALAHVDTPIAVAGPYRNNQHRLSAHQLPRGILKPAPVPQARFSFRRDLLSYVGESIASVASSVGTLSQQQQPSGGGDATTTIAYSSGGSQQQQHGSLQYVQKDNGQPPLQTAPQPATATATAAAQRGAFWRRIGGAVNAVASQVPAAQAVAQRTFSQLSSSSSSPSTSEPVPLPPSSSSSPIASTSTLPTVESDTTLLDSIKSVRFTMSNLTVVYPINAPAPPGTEATTRKRINREYRARIKERTKRGGWTGDELLRLYDECCRTREEPGIEQIRRLLMNSAQPPKVIDLKDVPLSKGAIEVLSDLLSVDFSLRRLSLENCGLDDDSLKPLIHALLCSGTLPTLSLANNKRIRSKGWKLVAVLVKRANQLKYLDVSENLVDRKVAEILVDALVSKGGELRQRQHVGRTEQTEKENGHAHRPLVASHGTGSEAEGQAGDPSTDGEGEEDLPPQWAAPLLSHRRRPHSSSLDDAGANGISSSRSSSLTSLRLEACQLKNPALECLAHGIRQSGIKHISLRRNRITHSGAVALAVMIRDYELPPGGGTEAASAGTTSSAANGLFPAGMLSPPLHGEERPPSPALSATNGYSTPPLLARSSQHIRSPPPANSVTARLEAAAQAAAASSSSRAPPALPPKTSRSSSLLSTSSTVQSTSSTLIDDIAAPGTFYSEDDRESSFGPERNRGRVVVLPEREAARHAELKARLRKQIDALPRVGCLLTLDVRSNEIKGGVTYIAQVLKRNRTLKVLNLSDNKIDSQGLMSIAEALKYNSTLETLDLSNNACCGTSLEGVNTLRTALAFNSSLMRVFLTNTDFNTSAAISLAEFLPEVHSLIHLDLTDNADIELAGIMALAAAVRLNTTLRCLDLSIPPNDPEYARLSQDVLQSCIRNTEAAQEQSAAKGIAKTSIATPIYKSEIARELREISEHGRRTLEKAERCLLASSSALPGSTTADEGTGGGELDLRRTVETAKECIGILRETIEPDEERKRKSEALQGAETVKLVLDQAYAATSQLEELRKRLQGKQREAAGIFSSHLGSLLARAKTLYANDEQQQQAGPGGLALDPGAGLLSPLTPVKAPLSPSEQLPSPNFSITSSDDDEDDESDTYSLDGDGRTPTVSPVKGARHDQARPPRPASLELPPPIFEAPASADASPRSPVEKSSRIMVSEEAEVFRKSTAKVSDGATSKTLLDVLDDDESEDKGAEELKKELLDAAVEKKTRRSSLMDLDGLEPVGNE